MQKWELRKPGEVCPKLTAGALSLANKQFKPNWGAAIVGSCSQPGGRWDRCICINTALICCRPFPWESPFRGCIYTKERMQNWELRKRGETGLKRTWQLHKNSLAKKSSQQTGALHLSGLVVLIKLDRCIYICIYIYTYIYIYICIYNMIDCTALGIYNTYSESPPVCAAHPNMLLPHTGRCSWRGSPQEARPQGEC